MQGQGQEHAKESSQHQGQQEGGDTQRIQEARTAGQLHGEQKEVQAQDELEHQYLLWRPRHRQVDETTSETLSPSSSLASVFDTREGTKKERKERKMERKRKRQEAKRRNREERLARKRARMEAVAAVAAAGRK
jgi:hypothetical protein